MRTTFCRSALALTLAIQLIIPRLEAGQETASADIPDTDGILKKVESNPDLVDIGSRTDVKLDIRYATEDNFMKRNVYGSYRGCFLHKSAAEKLDRAISKLKEAKPGWKLRIFDCLRPRSIQKILWSYVKGTSQQAYVADPAAGSVHNYGFAIDLSLEDETGKEIDMGTHYDFFGPLAEPKHEAEFLKSGKLSQAQLDNRLILRKAMTEAGFIVIPNEWWHFDALPRAELRKKHKIIE